MTALERFDTAAGLLPLLPVDRLQCVVAGDLQAAMGLAFDAPVLRWRAMVVEALEAAWFIGEALADESEAFAELMRLAPVLQIEPGPWLNAADALQRLEPSGGQAAGSKREDAESALRTLTNMREELARLTSLDRRGGRPDHVRTFFAARLAEVFALTTGEAPRLFGVEGGWRAFYASAEALVGFPTAASGQGYTDLARRVSEIPAPKRVLADLAAATSGQDGSNRIKVWRRADLPSAAFEILSA